MSADVSVLSWTEAVAGPDEGIPALVAGSRALAEAHRLDLALFVAFEEGPVRVGESLTRCAPPGEPLQLAARQTSDDACHLEAFGARLDASLAAAAPDRGLEAEALLLRVLQGGRAAEAAPLRREEVTAAVVVPPLRRFLDHCRAEADAGAFVEALALLDVLLKSAAGAVAACEALYWGPIDLYLARLARAAGIDEARHVARGAGVVRHLLAGRPAQRERVRTLCGECRPLLEEAFRYYVRKLVGLFGVVVRRHPERFEGVELAPGVALRNTPAEEQVALIRAGSAAAQGRALAQAGVA